MLADWPGSNGYWIWRWERCDFRNKISSWSLQKTGFITSLAMVWAGGLSRLSVPWPLLKKALSIFFDEVTGFLVAHTKRLVFIISTVRCCFVYGVFIVFGRTALLRPSGTSSEGGHGGLLVGVVVFAGRFVFGRQPSRCAAGQTPSCTTRRYPFTCYEPVKPC
jgi:hypothetical protein